MGLDGFLLGAAERFAHRLQRWTGLTNFWLARQCYRVRLLYCPLFGGAVVLQLTEKPGLAGFAGVILVLLAIFFLIDLMLYRLRGGKMRLVEDHYLAGNATAHTLTLIWRGSGSARLMNLLLWAFLLYVWARPPTNAFYILAAMAFLMDTVGDYFRACIPLPPGKSKVREFLESLSASLRPAHAEAP